MPAQQTDRVPKQPLEYKRKVTSILHSFKLLLGALTIIGATGSGTAMANESAFSEGHWSGRQIEDNTPPGCMMSMQLDDTTDFGIFATSNGSFDLVFYSENWSIPTSKDVNVYLELDGEPVTFTRLFLPAPGTIIIRGITPDAIQKLEDLMRQAENMKLVLADLNYSAHTTFYDNHLAVSALKNCVKAEARKAKQAQENQ